jgi:hypothetical protein
MRIPLEAGTLVENRHHEPAGPSQELYLQGSFWSRARVEHRIAHKLRDKQKHVVQDRRRQPFILTSECLPRGSGGTIFSVSTRFTTPAS